MSERGRARESTRAHDRKRAREPRVGGGERARKMKGQKEERRGLEMERKASF